MLSGALSKKTNSFLLRLMNSFGSYYQTVKLFSEVQQTPGNKDKLAKIREFNSSLSEVQKKQFFNLLQWYSRKESVRLSSKIINKYYHSHYAYQSLQTEEGLTERDLMRRLCKQDKESQLTLFDVNLFLRYLSAAEGKGSQADKAKKIIQFGENVSVLEGEYLLKLIQKKLSIGASKKTFRKMDQKIEEQQQIEEIATQKQSKPKQTKNRQIEQPENLTQLQRYLKFTPKYSNIESQPLKKPKKSQETLVKQPDRQNEL